MSNSRSNSEMNPTEALFGFVSWLTTREEPVTLSSSTNVGDILSLLEEWIDVHNLPECRPGWEDNIKNMNKRSSSNTPQIFMDR